MHQEKRNPIDFASYVRSNSFRLYNFVDAQTAD